MRTHTNRFKNEMIELGRELSILITYDDVTLTNEDLVSVKPNFETELLKSIMTGLEIQTIVDIPEGTEINFRWGIKVDGDYEYLDYGNYTVYSSERQENTNTYKIVAYDGMLESMKEYKGLSIDFPCTLQDYVSALATEMGWTYTPIEFTNYNNLIQDVWVEIGENDTKKSLGYTYRDVLDDIAEATACNIIIKNNELLMITPNETQEIIPEDFIKTTLAQFSTYGPINAVVLSRSSSDNIYARDVESIEENGLYEIKISDNQILNGNDRNNYITNIYNVLHNLTFTLCDFTSTGIGYFEPLDMYTLQIGEKTYNNLIMLNDELVLQDGIIENIHTDEPTFSETDYMKADTTDLRLNQTTLIVDKQGQQIQGLITNTTENTQNISSLTQTVSGFDARITQASTDSSNATSKVAELSLDVAELRSEIGDVTDTTVTQEGYGILSFENINASEPIRVEIHAMADSDIAYLYPSSALYPNGTLYPKNRILRFTNTSTNEVWDYVLPDNLRYYSTTVYDEFLLDYESDICQVTKKVGINEDRTKYALVTETTTQYTYPRLELTQGDYTVELLGYPNAYIKVRLMSQNMYTSQFATKVEMRSSITQKANEITSEVAETYETKDDAQELSSRITQNANSITSEVTNRQNADNALSSRITQNATNIESKVSKGSIISTINQSAESVQINASKISLAGKAINLTSDNTVIKSTNFNVDKNGNMTCSKATITGGSITLNGNSGARLIRVQENNSNSTMAYIMPNLVAINNNSDRVEIGCGSYPSVDVFRVGVSGTYITHTGITTPSVTQTSRESEKKNFEKFSNALEKLKQIDIYKYNLKSEDDETKKHIGFVIGDKYKYSEEVTSADNSGVDIYSFVSLCCQAIKEQQEEIENLKKRLEEI